ncbi:MAG: hypothetical protein QNJ56_10950 [Gammaproteobacteria bacterium]|nr:hypothetical protein [Gammaproteobacteria bacterium]
MSSLEIKIPIISDLALGIMKRVIDENEKTQKITDEQSGPIPLASAMSDFFQIASALENGQELEDSDAISDLADYALDLVDRLKSQLWYLDIHDQRDALSRLFASLAVWFARQDAILNNLNGAADSFAILVNGENDKTTLASMSRQMDELLQAASNEIKMDEDRSDNFRPWRVLNLNSGVAATRSFNAELMQSTFDNMGRRLPYDMPGFLADGKRQASTQQVPEEVIEVLNQYAEKWPAPKPH